MVKSWVLFDFDGVIANTFDMAYLINKEADHDLTENEYKSFFTGNIYERMKKGTSLTPTQFFKRADSEMMNNPPFAGMPKVIEKLAETHQLAIISSTNTNPIRQYLALYDLDHYFDDVLGGDVDTSKVVKFKLLLDKHHIEPSNCTFITDTLGDIREASTIPIRTIAVTWGYHPKETLAQGNPATIVESVQDLVRAVG